jgi:bidirectional [NiFe] hydrogenase diaphorase subunit
VNVEELHEIAEQTQAAQAQFETRIVVCSGTACQSAQSEQVIEQLQAELRQRGLEKRCAITGGGCRGLCAAGPMVTVQPQDVMYQGVKPEDAPAIIDSLERAPVERLRCDMGVPFFARQKRVVLEFAGLLNPDHIDDYIAEGGFETFLKVLTQMTSADVIDELRRSGLRGRGSSSKKACRWKRCNESSVRCRHQRKRRVCRS